MSLVKPTGSFIIAPSGTLSSLNKRSRKQSPLKENTHINKNQRCAKVNVDELERLLNERYDLIKRALEDERDLMLLNEDLTAEERELINIQFIKIQKQL